MTSRERKGKVRKISLLYNVSYVTLAVQCKDEPTLTNVEFRMQNVEFLFLSFIWFTWLI